MMNLLEMLLTQIDVPMKKLREDAIMPNYAHGMEDSGMDVYAAAIAVKENGDWVEHDNYTLAKPSKIIISEGLFTLTEKVKDAFNFKIYVDIDEKIKKERFYVRAKERDLGDSADFIYKNANDKAEVHIRPCKKYADIVLSGSAERIKYKNFLNKIIGVIQELYYQ